MSAFYWEKFLVDVRIHRERYSILSMDEEWDKVDRETLLLGPALLFPSNDVDNSLVQYTYTNIRGFIKSPGATVICQVFLFP